MVLTWGEAECQYDGPRRMGAVCSTVVAVKVYCIRIILMLWVRILWYHRGVLSLEDWYNMQFGPLGTLRTPQNVYGVGSPTVTFFFRPPAHLWNIVECDEATNSTTNKYNSWNYKVHVLNDVLNYKTKVQLFRDQLQWFIKSPSNGISGIVYRFALEVVWRNENYSRWYFETNKPIYIL